MKETWNRSMSRREETRKGYTPETRDGQKLLPVAHLSPLPTQGWRDKGRKELGHRSVKARGLRGASSLSPCLWEGCREEISDPSLSSCSLTSYPASQSAGGRTQTGASQESTLGAALSRKHSGHRPSKGGWCVLGGEGAKQQIPIRAWFPSDSNYKFIPLPSFHKRLVNF